VILRLITFALVPYFSFILYRFEIYYPALPKHSLPLLNTQLSGYAASASTIILLKQTITSITYELLMDAVQQAHISLASLFSFGIHNLHISLAVFSRNGHNYSRRGNALMNMFFVLDDVSSNNPGRTAYACSCSKACCR
jgi:hypothetical protein